MTVTIAAVDATHFSYGGLRLPRVYVAFPADGDGARIVNTFDPAEKRAVPAGSTVDGAVPGTQNALIDALAEIVGGGAAASGGGSTIATGPAGPHDFASGALTVTLADGDEQVVTLQGVALPRFMDVNPVSGDTIRVRQRASATSPWRQDDELLAITFASTDEQKQHKLDAPIHSIGITRTVGAGTTSTVVIA